MNEREGQTGGDVSIEANAGKNLTFELSGDADVYVTRPRNTPLSVSEPHATVKIAADYGIVELELNGEQLDAVIDALHSVQSFHMEGGPDA